MRKLLSVSFLALGLAVAPAAAHADSITYNLVLTPTTPGSNVGLGTGSLTISSAPSASGNSDFNTSTGGLTALSFSIGGDNFDLTNAVGISDAFFQNGNLLSVSYIGGDINKSVDFSLVAGALTYTFVDLDNYGSNDLTEFSQGTISATIDPPVAPAVPEPSALLLFGTGALGLAGIVSRKLMA